MALWFDLPDDAVDRMRTPSNWISPAALHATEHAAIGILPLFALCDRNDIGGVSTPFHPDTGKPQIFIYDGHPGGVGIAEKGFELIERLWQVTLDSVRECPCQEGCPSCIQSPKCGNNNKPLDKKAARLFWRGWWAGREHLKPMPFGMVWSSTPVPVTAASSSNLIRLLHNTFPGFVPFCKKVVLHSCFFIENHGCPGFSVKCGPMGNAAVVWVSMPGKVNPGVHHG